MYEIREMKIVFAFFVAISIVCVCVKNWRTIVVNFFPHKHQCTIMYRENAYRYNIQVQRNHYSITHCQTFCIRHRLVGKNGGKKTKLEKKKEKDSSHSKNCFFSGASTNQRRANDCTAPSQAAPSSSSIETRESVLLCHTSVVQFTVVFRLQMAVVCAFHFVSPLYSMSEKWFWFPLFFCSVPPVKITQRGTQESESAKQNKTKLKKEMKNVN